MARLISYFDDGPFANVDFQVGGRFGVRVGPDVTLVQALLRSIYDIPALDRASPLRNRLAVTGRMNADTTTLITHFQNTETGFTADGIISKAPPGGSIFQHSGKTILALNLTLRAGLQLMNFGSDQIAFLVKSFPQLRGPLSRGVVPQLDGNGVTEEVFPSSDNGLVGRAAGR